MAERPSELIDESGIDALGRSAGAGTEPYRDDKRNLETASLEMLKDTDDGTEDTEHIKAQIEETRSQMGETIDAIQEKLSFANMSEQVSEQVSNAIETAKDSIYDATVGKAVDFMKNFGDGISETKVVRTVQDNPFPVLLIGIGAGLLVYQSYSSKNKRPIRGLGRYEPASGGRRLESDFRSQRTDREHEGVSGALSAAGSTVRETAESAYSSVSNAAGSAYESVAGTVSEAYSGAGEAVSRAKDAAVEYGSIAQQKYEYYIDENPLAVGAVAVALGAAVGLAFPSTRYEGQLMGEARQNLVDKAQSAAGELVEKAKQVAGEAGETIKEEARALTQ